MPTAETDLQGFKVVFRREGRDDEERYLVAANLMVAAKMAEPYIEELGDIVGIHRIRPGMTFETSES